MMETFTVTWKSEYNTGIETVDNQHKTLFKLYEKFATAYLLKEDKPMVANCLFELEDYTQKHFEEEEQVLEKYGKEISKHHKQQHLEFIQMLHDLKFDYVSDNKKISNELLDYLYQWLQDHILIIDKIELAIN